MPVRARRPARHLARRLALNVSIAVSLAFATAVPNTGAQAQTRPAAAESVQMGNYVDLLNAYYATGCVAGAATFGAASFIIIPYLTAYVLSFMVSGCAFGFLAGPVGLIIRDHVTGDNAVDRYIAENW